MKYAYHCSYASFLCKPTSVVFLTLSNLNVLLSSDKGKTNNWIQVATQQNATLKTIPNGSWRGKQNKWWCWRGFSREKVSVNQSLKKQTTSNRRRKPCQQNEPSWSYFMSHLHIFHLFYKLDTGKPLKLRRMHFSDLKKKLSYESKYIYTQWVRREMRKLEVQTVLNFSVAR